MPQVYFSLPAGDLEAVDHIAETRFDGNRSQVLREAVTEYLHGRTELTAEGAGPLLDPACRAGDCEPCPGAPCEHSCHAKEEADG